MSLFHNCNSNKKTEITEYEVCINYEGKKYSYSRATNKLVNSLDEDIKDIEKDSLDAYICTTKTNSYGIINELDITKK